MTKKYIAVIYEGERTENQLVWNLNQVFFSENLELVPIMFPAGENIYMLWKQLKKDEFETDVIEVLRESSNTAKKVLERFTRDDFMEVYLFFDYDGHHNNLTPEEKGEDVLAEMLETFCEETELGKLYINYPMVESLRDNFHPEEERCYRRCAINISDISTYKRTVHDMKKYQDFRHLSKQNWNELCINGLKKINCIIKGKYEIPERKIFLSDLTQKKLYEQQNKQFIAKGKIAVVNSFPLFVYEYFKESIWK